MEHDSRSMQRPDSDAHWLRTMVVLAVLGMAATLLLAAGGVGISDLMR